MKLAKQGAVDIGVALSATAREHFAGTRLNNPRLSALVAGATYKGPVLIEFDYGAFQPTVKGHGSEPAYGCIGSGQQICDPFLAFLTKVLVANEEPTLAQAKIMAYWTLRHACDFNPGGISEPIQMGVIEERSGGKYVARELRKDELAGIDKAVSVIENKLADLLALNGVVTPLPTPG